MEKTHHNEHHTVSFSTYFLIWLSLIGLTVITVAVAGINLGPITLLVALGIAAIKSLLVINIFMHIKFDDILFKLFVVLAVVTLLTIFGLTAFDFNII